MSPSIHLHGLDLDPDDALRLNVAALQALGEHVETETTFHGFEVASTFLHTTMVDAVSVLGLSIADLVKYTELEPGVVLDVIGEGFQPFSPGAMS